jgi:8-oxo-dGTP pyrophosphatase MutT (NUDIX family)
MISAQQIAMWADRLRDLSALGLWYATSQYDTDRYQAIQDLALEMLAAATGETVASLEPLRAPIFSRPTPFASGDAAIIDDDGRILLIQRADNGRWAMPGGALEVGETPAEGVAREAFEETGYRCTATALVGVFDSRYCGTTSRHHLYQFVFVCRLDNAQPAVAASHAHEVRAMQWFAWDALPPDLDPGHVSRIPIAFEVWNRQRAPYFDQVAPPV